MTQTTTPPHGRFLYPRQRPPQIEGGLDPCPHASAGRSRRLRTYRRGKRTLTCLAVTTRNPLSLARRWSDFGSWSGFTPLQVILRRELCSPTCGSILNHAAL